MIFELIKCYDCLKLGLYSKLLLLFKQDIFEKFHHVTFKISWIKEMKVIKANSK